MPQPMQNCLHGSFARLFVDAPACGVIPLDIMNNAARELSYCERLDAKTEHPQMTKRHARCDQGLSFGGECEQGNYYPRNATTQEAIACNQQCVGALRLPERVAGTTIEVQGDTQESSSSTKSQVRFGRVIGLRDVITFRRRFRSQGHPRAPLHEISFALLRD